MGGGLRGLRWVGGWEGRGGWGAERAEVGGGLRGQRWVGG